MITPTRPSFDKPSFANAAYRLSDIYFHLPTNRGGADSGWAKIFMYQTALLL